MHVPRTAAPRADGQAIRQLRFAGRRKRARFLVADMDPLHPVGTADRIDHRVQAVSDYAVDPVHSGLEQYLYQLVSKCLTHRDLLVPRTGFWWAGRHSISRRRQGFGLPSLT